jgi:hypothetical protein
VSYRYIGHLKINIETEREEQRDKKDIEGKIRIGFYKICRVSKKEKLINCIN